jgi:hypothetical protein
MCLVFFPPPPAYCARPSLLPTFVPGFCFIPSSIHLTYQSAPPWKLEPHIIDRLYQHLISVNTVPQSKHYSTLIISLLSFLVFHSCNIILLAHVLTFRFTRVRASLVSFDRDFGSGWDSHANYRTIRWTPRSVLWKLISFSASHNVCERILLMSLHTQQRDSHCFLDGLSSLSFLIVKTHLWI